MIDDLLAFVGEVGLKLGLVICVVAVVLLLGIGLGYLWHLFLSVWHL